MKEITGQTRLCAVLGWPVEHSLSPPMQNAAIEALGLPWVYVALPVRPGELKQALEGARAMGFVGVNLTIPHKEAAIAELDEIDPVASAIGAVNTVHFCERGLVGYNTDAYGFTQSILSDGELTFDEATVLILGGGGVARGMAAGAAAEGARKVIIANRTRSRAERLVAELSNHYPDTRWEIVQASPSSLLNAAGRSEIIANATSLGMRPDDPLPIERECLTPAHVVFDSVYAPPQTALLLAAKDAGATCVGGLGMLARQGAKSLAIWSGLEPDEDLMLRVLNEKVRSRA